MLGENWRLESPTGRAHQYSIGEYEHLCIFWSVHLIVKLNAVGFYEWHDGSGELRL
jgi:hypothetical protein